MRSPTLCLLPALLVAFAVASCTETRGSGYSDVSGSGQAGPGHTDDQGGVLHYTGKTDPLTNCTPCHGADLQGADGPACLSCHDNDDHTANRDGVKHRSGSSSACTPCHGPSNTGGLAPACSSCHGGGDDDD